MHDFNVESYKIQMMKLEKSSLLVAHLKWCVLWLRLWHTASAMMYSNIKDLSELMQYDRISIDWTKLAVYKVYSNLGCESQHAWKVYLVQKVQGHLTSNNMLQYDHLNGSISLQIVIIPVTASAICSLVSMCWITIPFSSPIWDLKEWYLQLICLVLLVMLGALATTQLHPCCPQIP